MKARISRFYGRWSQCGQIKKTERESKLKMGKSYIPKKYIHMNVFWLQNHWPGNKRISFNPCLTEGRAKNAPPLLTFLDRSKTAADIDAKLSVPFPASIWRLPPKFQRNPLRNFWVNGVLVTSRFSDVIFSDFGSKSSKCLQASWMCTFEVKHNP